MDANNFYNDLVEIAHCPLDERHWRMADLHTSVVTRYLGAIRAITPEGATRIVPDGRTVAQVVSHIAE